MSELSIRQAEWTDLPELLEVEQACFSGDRISKRRFQHWLKATNCVFLIAESTQGFLGYGLVLLHKGTRLARLYSLAVASRGRQQGVAKQLMNRLEQDTAKRGRLDMRLEVATSNSGAIKLYESLGYRCFDEYSDYYEDHSDALRMQKRIRFMQATQAYKPTPWYQQTTDFSCGPASLMMAMASLDPEIKLSQGLELDIWREATTIFMTSGHGGCHPLGLALAAHRRGFKAIAYINSHNPLFIEGVRSEHKKSVMTAVDQQFHLKAETEGVQTIHADVTQNQIQNWLTEGYAVLVLISTYRMDGMKAPHWVTVTAVDDVCLYVHDPDPDEKHQLPIDCQHIPIARENFAKMSAFGNERLRTAVIIKKAST